MVLVSIAMIGLLLLVFFITSAIHIASFDKLEKDETLERVGILEKVLQNDVHVIDTSTRDYATWNDTYFFMIDQNQTFVDANLIPETYKNLEMSFIILVNTNGNVVFGKEYNRTTQILDPLSPGMMVHIALDGMIVSRCIAGNETMGLIMVDGQPVLFAARPILTSESQGPSEGALIMGRTIDEAVLSRWEDSIGLPIRLFEMNDPYLKAEIGEAGWNELVNDQRTIRALNETAMGGYALAKDIYGNPGVTIRATTERDIHAQGIVSEYTLVISLTIASLMFGIVTVLLLERTVVSRLSNLRQEVSRVGSTTEGEFHVTSQGKDEIGELAENINGMLATINTAQERLIESEKRYRGIVEDQNELIARFDPDLQVTFMNGTFLKTINMDWEKVKGKKLDQLMRPDTVEIIKSYVSKLDVDSPISTLEIPMTGPTGGMWVRTSIRPIHDNTGKISEYQTVGADITERKKAEEELEKYRQQLEGLVQERTLALMITNEELEKEIEERRKQESLLRESERRYRAVVEDQSELIARRTTDGTMTFANEAFYRFFGISPDTVMGTTYWPPEGEHDRTTALDSLKGLGPDQPVNSYDARMELSDGMVRWVNWTDRAIFDENGEMREVQSVGRDITEKMKLEQELLRAQKLESVGRIAGGIAHDFNNILTSIMGNIALVKLDPEVKGSTDQRLTDAENAVLRAKNLTQELLTFSEGGEPVKEVSSLEEMVRSSTEFTLSGAKVQSRMDFDKGLWMAEVDKGQFRQVINNIVLNAVEAMPFRGSLTIKGENVHLTTNQGLPLPPGDYVRLVISDTGVGISPENMSRIFDPFFTTKTYGSGLGLSASLSIIRKHGGHIEVVSEEGNGTTVGIYLPALSHIIPPTTEITVEEHRNKGSILLMDDEVSILDVMQELIDHLGYSVECSEHGADAIARYRKAKERGKPFDLVIMDLTIPGGMGGKEAIAEIRRFDPQVKAIVSSGYSHDPVMADPMKYGFIGVLQKPYTLKELEKKIKWAIDSGNGGQART